MNPILIAVCVVGAIGLLGGTLLVIGSKVFAVTKDERAEKVELALPGANCGACGYAGCSAYAKAVAEGAPVNQCLAGGAAVAEKIAAIMGVEAGAATEYKAMIACQGDTAHTKKRYEYHGIPSCAACNVLYNGDSSCPFGCLGFGDCARACKFGAIQVVDGVARVDEQKCTVLRCLRECVSQAHHLPLCLPGASQAHRHVLQPQKGRGYAAGLHGGLSGLWQVRAQLPGAGHLYSGQRSPGGLHQMRRLRQVRQGLSGKQHPYSEALAGKGRVTQQI